MKIFLLAHDYLDLYKPILKELMRQHDVSFWRDLKLHRDPYWKQQPILIRGFYYLLNYFRNVYDRYWQRCFIQYPDVFNCKYDLLFCVNSVSFSPILFKQLKNHNPKLRVVTFIWDTSRFYDYYHHQNYFDSIYTFDQEDSKKYKVTYLPFYWIPSSRNTVNTHKFSLSIVGSDHDKRYELVCKVREQLKKYGLTYCFKILGAPSQDSEISISTPLSIEDIQEIMMQSDAILDTDRETQTGITPRLIWALALGKKILTTNDKLKNNPLYNPKQIMIIDRDNPQIDVDFIVRSFIPLEENVRQMACLRIDKWIGNFLSQVND